MRHRSIPVAAALVAAIACGGGERAPAPARAPQATRAVATPAPVSAASPDVAGATAPIAASDPLPAGKPVVVAVSVVPQKFFVDRVAGERAEVEVMIPPGASPSSWEPSLDRLSALERARLYLKVGHPHFPFEETWLGRILAERPDLTVVDTSAGLARRDDDPHVWLSAAGARVMAKNIAAALAAALPAHQGELDENLARLLAEVDAVERDVRAKLAGRRGARFFVFHPAWGYFAREHGLVQVAVERDGKDPDARTMGELIRAANEVGATTVFIQPQIARAGAELLAAEIGGRVVSLDPLAYDWAENLRRTADAIAEATRAQAGGDGR